jgi:hypothetical protein
MALVSFWIRALREWEFAHDIARCHGPDFGISSVPRFRSDSPTIFEETGK